MKKALTIAGSDSSGGAGLQADLKTFQSRGVHGSSVVTCVTSQNMQRILDIFPLSPKAVSSQLKAVFRDISFDACKTGMLYTPEAVEAVSSFLKKKKLPLVVDPVVLSGTGQKLITEEGIDAITSDLIPIATIVTPNKLEAERLGRMRIRTVRDQRKACRKILKLGAGSVVVKGGHLDGTDVFYDGNSFREYRGDKLRTGTVHGSGCMYSACIAAELAKGTGVKEALTLAKDLATHSIRNAVKVGRGNRVAQAVDSRPAALGQVDEAVGLIESCPSFWRLIPEVQTNIGQCTVAPGGPEDIAAVPGRLVRSGREVKKFSRARFGTSRHIASLILSAYHHDFRIKSCMNIRHDKELLSVCRGMRLKCVGFSRKDEPAGVKRKEGRSLEWGLEQAVRKNKGEVPDIVFDEGEKGKEAMIRIFGRNAREVAQKAVRIAEKYEKKGR